MNNILHALYNLVLSLWIGGISIFTFIITPVIFKSFGRDMAGKIVGKLFPGYFMYNLALSVIALILFLVIRSAIAHPGHKWSMILIVMAIVINIFVTFKLHPDVKEVKKEIHSLENLAGDAPVRKKFGKLHAASASLNLLLLADGVALLIMSSVFKK